MIETDMKGYRFITTCEGDFMEIERRPPSSYSFDNIHPFMMQPFFADAVNLIGKKNLS